jgi:hypothetical protein
MNRAFSAAFLKRPYSLGRYPRLPMNVAPLAPNTDVPFGRGPTASFRCDLSVARNIGALGDKGEWRIESKIYHNFIAFVA